MGRFINADGLINGSQNNDILGYNMYVYCGNNSVNRYDPNGSCWHRLWTTDCSKCVTKKKNSVSITGLFNATVNVATNYTASKTGNPSLAKEIGDKIKIGDGYSSPGLQRTVNELSKYDVSIGVSAGFGIPTTPIGVQAGVGSTASLGRGSKDYVYLGANGGHTFAALLPFSIALDFDMRRAWNQPYINSGFSHGLGVDTFFGASESGAMLSTEIGISYGANYYLVWDKD